MGVVIALAFCFLVWFLLFRTSYGTKLRIIGDNPVFARYTGLKVTGIMVLAQAIAGAIAGIGGGTELLGIYNRFKWTASPGYSKGRNNGGSVMKILSYICSADFLFMWIRVATPILFAALGSAVCSQAGNEKKMEEKSNEAYIN